MVITNGNTLQTVGIGITSHVRKKKKKQGRTYRMGKAEPHMPAPEVVIGPLKSHAHHMQLLM